jgi:hypothetical protein
VIEKTEATTVDSFCRRVQAVGEGNSERRILIKYGSIDARISMEVQLIELDNNGNVVVVVEA